MLACAADAIFASWGASGRGYSPRVADAEEQQETLAAPLSDAKEEAARPRLASATAVPERYVGRGEIGRGGMGTVEAWSDPHIGREVAAKVLIQDAPGYQERFLHEARTQGSLAHPAIVPVHDLSFLPDGRPFFTMQRVHGVTLAAILAGRAQGNELVSRFSTRKLLEALARIALAVDYAHRRDVVHRDLKPANLMLGDFGEVYVLDWGIARRGAGVASSATPAGPEMPAPPGVTAHGTLLGTPGYMAPEQARGGGEVDARADVYALGCVLFEILARTPLHEGSRITDLLVSTLSESTERSPARRAGTEDIPPELDLLCLSATEPVAASRLPSARDLADGIERYLEGDRDLAARAAAAEEHALRAAGDAEIALGGMNEGRGVTTAEAERARRRALYEVGRAMALSPQHPGATRTLVALLTEPPAVLPREVQVELDDIVTEHVRVGGRTGAVAYGVAALIFAILLAVGVVQWATGAWLPVVLFGGAALTSYAFSRLPQPGTQHSVVMLVLSTFAITSLSTIFSPFFGVPTAVCVNTMLFVLSNERRIRRFVVPIGALGVLLPILGELIGLTPPSYRVESGTIVLLPRFMAFTQTSVVVLTLSFVLTTVIAALALGPFRDDLDREQRRSRLLSWQLRQFVPSASPAPTEGTRGGPSPT